MADVPVANRGLVGPFDTLILELERSDPLANRVELFAVPTSRVRYVGRIVPIRDGVMTALRIR